MISREYSDVLRYGAPEVFLTAQVRTQRWLAIVYGLAIQNASSSILLKRINYWFITDHQARVVPDELLDLNHGGNPHKSSEGLS